MTAAEPGTRVPPAEPGWLGEGERAVFVMLHRPAGGPPPETAVIACPPFGWGEACSYQDLRAWASALAAAGFACARMWPPGAGDSGGSPRGGAHLAAGVTAVGDTASWLRGATGARRIVALGIGYGGLLSCLAAERGAPIDDFVLWGVPARGRTMLRHERVHAGVVTALSAEEVRAELPGEPGALQLVGYYMSAETVTALQQLELHPETWPAAAGAGRRALLLGRDGLPVDDALRERFAAAGFEVQVEDGPDWLEFIGPPQETVAPRATIERSIAWLAQRSPDPGAEGGEDTGEVRSGLRAAAAAVVDAAGAVSERAVHFTGEIEGSFAIISEPARGPAAPLTAVWMSPEHPGPSRLGVELARRWAAQGVTTVRVGMLGLGESSGDAPRPLPSGALYDAERAGQLPALLAQLPEHGVPERFVVGGYCAGAYWALRAALEVPGVAGALLLNLYAFDYSDELVAERRAAGGLDDLGARVWQRLRERGVSGADVRAALGRLRPAHLRAGVRRPLERRQREQSDRMLARLHERGIPTAIVLCQGEALQGEVERLIGWPNVTVGQLPTRDHFLWDIDVQRQVHAVLGRALDEMVAERPAAAG